MARLRPPTGILAGRTPPGRSQSGGDGEFLHPWLLRRHRISRHTPFSRSLSRNPKWRGHSKRARSGECFLSRADRENLLRSICDASVLQGDDANAGWPSNPRLSTPPVCWRHLPESRRQMVRHSANVSSLVSAGDLASAVVLLLVTVWLGKRLWVRWISAGRYARGDGNSRPESELPYFRDRQDRAGCAVYWHSRVSALVSSSAR